MLSSSYMRTYHRYFTVERRVNNGEFTWTTLNSALKKEMQDVRELWQQVTLHVKSLILKTHVCVVCRSIHNSSLSKKSRLNESPCSSSSLVVFMVISFTHPLTLV
jgi:hypothetical protein